MPNRYAKQALAPVVCEQKKKRAEKAVYTIARTPLRKDFFRFPSFSFENNSFP
jgi:hypothetical protein